MPPVIAHGTGIDDLLIAAVATLAFVGTVALRRGERRRHSPLAAGPCAYCGEFLPAELRRCSHCGFRAKRAPESAGPSR
ncbi:MAG: hypothetical protein ACT4PO_00145 [Actinomycetota bacterium]